MSLTAPLNTVGLLCDVAERKRSKAQELLQLAEDTKIDPIPPAAGPVQPATKPTPAVPENAGPPAAQQQAEAAATAASAADLQPAGSGGLSGALLAAQQLLQSMHPANVPGLGFSKVVRQHSCASTGIC